MGDALYFPLALLVVMWCSARRFDTPSPVRSFTTAPRYLAGIAAYIAAGALFYFALSAFVWYALATQVGAALGGLAMAAIAVRLPLIREADRWLRRRLKAAIGYPSEAHRLAAMLASAPLTPPEKVREHVRSVLLRRGYDPRDDWLPAAQPMRELLERSAALFEQIRGWDRHARYAGFVAGVREEFDVLRQRFDQLTLKVVRVMGTIEKLGGLWGEVETAMQPSPPGRRATDYDQARERCGATVRAAVNEMLADLREDIAFFQRNLCMLVARGVLATSITARQRQARLGQLGFSVELQPASTLVLLLWAGALYFTVFLVAMLLLPQLLSLNSETALEQLARASRVTLVQMIGVALAVVPKQYFGFANEDLHGRTPWRFVLSAALAAAALAFLLNLAVLGSEHVGRSLPWLGMPLLTAGVLAYLVQDSRWMHWSLRRQRLADIGLVLAAVATALATARVVQYLNGSLPTTSRVVYTSAMLLLAAVGIGAFLPSACRHPARHKPLHTHPRHQPAGIHTPVRPHPTPLV
jgi:hypothetical protein